ncbi:sensor histidine kinase [Phenylobacterium sp.]|uniref:sensor histidine kinase n=1 Tax=Phenylobacterium sp. TaxID=1871053 RepID=UPI002EDA764B
MTGVSVGDDNESMEQLRERLRRLEAAVEATGIGLWEWDVRSGELTWNDRNRELLGVDHDRPLTIQDYPGMVHPDDLELVRTAYREAVDQPEGYMLLCEYRTAPAADGKSRWVQQRARVLKDAEGVARVVGATLDITDRKTAEERRSLVLRELAHRAKNGIMVMMTIVSQTARNAGSVKEFEAVLTARLQSMVDSQDLVTQVSGRSLPLGDLLDRALTPFDPGRFDVGKGVREINIANDMVVALALLIHELSTNAVKYGALSAPAGRVRLTMKAAEEGRAHLEWREVDGPTVAAPTSKGFGTRLLDISLRNNDGRVEPHFDPDGFRADIHFPMGRA